MFFDDDDFRGMWGFATGFLLPIGAWVASQFIDQTKDKESEFRALSTNSAWGIKVEPISCSQCKRKNDGLGLGICYKCGTPLSAQVAAQSSNLGWFLGCGFVLLLLFSCLFVSFMTNMLY